MSKSKIPTIVACLVCAAWAIGVSVAQANAVELVVNTHAPEVQSKELKDLISANIPPAVTSLGPDYQLLAVVETSEYKPGERLYFYSVMLHRQVVDVATKKKYWVPTGGVRSHGVIARSEQLLENLQADLVAGASSFKLDQ